VGKGPCGKKRSLAAGSERLLACTRNALRGAFQGTEQIDKGKMMTKMRKSWIVWGKGIAGKHWSKFGKEIGKELIKNA
jgi:hypothetical protein